LIGCRRPQQMIVMDSENGQILASFPIGKGVDATAFDDGKAFASCGDGSLFVFNVQDTKMAPAATIKIAEGARTMGVDKTTHTIYLPTAELEPAAQGARPKPKPDTFKIVVVGQS
jgi:hypothetical protein